MSVANATVAEFAGFMQRYVLDRPVVDQTGIAGKYDFELSWMPDQTQFGGNMAEPDATTRPDDATARASLYTAIQEQLGLRLVAKDDLADVVVLERAEHPSEN
jgi:uncharacterized protein (TIGR03435 family)